MRKLAALALSTAAVGTMFSTPAKAIEVCDPIIPRGICVYINDPRSFCPGGYRQILRVPNPLGGVILLVCVLQ